MTPHTLKTPFGSYSPHFALTLTQMTFKPLTVLNIHRMMCCADTEISWQD